MVGLEGQFGKGYGRLRCVVGEGVGKEGEEGWQGL